MMTRLWSCVLGGSIIAALATASLGAAAQTAFDMRGSAAPTGAAVEPAFDVRAPASADGVATGRPAFHMGDGAGGPTGAPTAPAANFPTTTPFGMQPGGPAAEAPAPSTKGDSPAGDVAPFQMVPGQAVAPAASQTERAGPRIPDRFLVPIQRLRLEGESESYSWVTYFTQQEVERPATLLIGYSNSIYVMPELSRLRVTVNGQFVADLRIASPQGVSQVAQAIPAGVLRAGGNVIRFEMQAVHRTDCSLDSTYDLWTEFDNSQTGVAFQGGPGAPPAVIDDLPAIGVDARGTTQIRFIRDRPIEPSDSKLILSATQAIALRGKYPHPVVSIVGPDAGPAPTGTLNVVLGTSENLRAALAFPPSIARGQPLLRVVNDRRAGGPTLVLGGDTEGAVEGAIDRLAAGTDHADDDRMSTSTAYSPDPPFFWRGGSVRFSTLGVPTQEFSGRRLRIRFPIALPADFYGAANGRARILLNAAYAPSVRPGSQLSVYVNGSLASSYTLTSQHGGLMEHKVINIPLTHFRAGINRVWMEVVLNVDSDKTCEAGATLQREQRFVLFDTSEFVMDDFARIGTEPNLAAFFGRGYPYFRQTQPIAVVMRHDVPTVATAATIMARLAVFHEKATPVDTAPSSASLNTRPVLFIGAINQIPPDVVSQVGVANASRIRWLGGSPGEDTGDSPTGGEGAPQVAPDALAMLDTNIRVRSGSGNEDIYDRWRDQVAGETGISAALLHFEKWFKDTFDISLGFSEMGNGGDLFNPPPGTSVLVAQGFAPGGSAVWTLVTGYTSESLLAGIDSFTMGEYWLKPFGRAVAYDATTGRMDIRTPTQRRFVVTEPLWPSNLRLIAANWLSLNILTYALVLILCCIAFALVTTLMLRRRPRGGR